MCAEEFVQAIALTRVCRRKFDVCSSKSAKVPTTIPTAPMVMTWSAISDLWSAQPLNPPPVAKSATIRRPPPPPDHGTPGAQNRQRTRMAR